MEDSNENNQKNEQVKEETTKKGKKTIIVLVLLITLPILILLFILFWNIGVMIFNSANQVINEASNSTSYDTNYNDSYSNDNEYDSSYNDIFDNTTVEESIIPFNGQWIVEEDGELQYGNYFEFNDDNTFSFAASGSGISTGTYSFDNGATTVSGEMKYESNGYTLYDVILSPEEVKLDDGRVLNDNLNQLEYVIGINGDDMIAQNLSTKSITYLKKQ